MLQAITSVGHPDRGGRAIEVDRGGSGPYPSRGGAEGACKVDLLDFSAASLDNSQLLPSIQLTRLPSCPACTCVLQKLHRPLVVPIVYDHIVQKHRIYVDPWLHGSILTGC